MRRYLFRPQSVSHALSSAITGSRNASSVARKVIFSGIQPTGIPHLGNYLGALQRWVQQQNEADSNTTNIYSLVDLHAITVRQDPAQLRRWRKESLAVLLAVGLDPDKSTIFFQSHVPAHSELMWILSCTASIGYLHRMTQWKSKAELESNPKLGLLSYPVLQAADILVHRATHVPVGEDQSQHLEFARNCANSFNAVYHSKDILVEPETLLSPAKRIMSLTDPTKKMSKSDPNERSRILITDDKKTIQKKVARAVTDSEDRIFFDPESRPGLSNLLQVMSYVEGRADSLEDLARELDGSSKKAIKERLTDAIERLFAPSRDRYAMLIAKEKYLEEVTENGARKANASAATTMKIVRDAIGF